MFTESPGIGMTNPTVHLPTLQERLIAENVSAEEYMEHYAEHFCEWVEGRVYRLSPISIVHMDFTNFLVNLLETYFTLRNIGRVLQAPFVMEGIKTGRRREPDIQIILYDNTGTLEATRFLGAADICIEVVSPGTSATDYGEKFLEYEKEGVREYWMFDPERETTTFYRLQENGRYIAVQPDSDGRYRTPLLPDFALLLTDLWNDNLPNIIEIVEIVRAMVEKKED